MNSLSIAIALQQQSVLGQLFRLVMDDLTKAYLGQVSIPPWIIFFIDDYQ